MSTLWAIARRMSWGSLRERKCEGMSVPAHQLLVPVVHSECSQDVANELEHAWLPALAVDGQPHQRLARFAMLKSVARGKREGSALVINWARRQGCYTSREEGNSIGLIANIVRESRWSSSAGAQDVLARRMR